eukprot:m.491130 g.491130  ORF g.491130 m.491130 type:complete len:404 (-) comp29346_c0_seq1:193-1404(-)
MMADAVGRIVAAVASVAVFLAGTCAGADDIAFETIFAASTELGCVRFPNVAVVPAADVGGINASHYVFVECYKASGDHCTVQGLPKVPNCHAYGNVCYRNTSDNGVTWSPVQRVPVTTEWARGHSSLYDPKTNKLCVHYNGGSGTRDTQWVGWRYAQCMDVRSGVWEAAVNITSQLAPACQRLLGSRQTTLQLPSGRQLFSQWLFPSHPVPYICVYASDDHGATFHTVLQVNRSSEGALTLLSNGSVYFNARPPHPPHRVTAYSSDGGSEWDVNLNSTHSPMGATTDVVPGPLLVVPRPAAHGNTSAAPTNSDSAPSPLFLALPMGPGRANMTLFRSLDNGETWSGSLLINSDYGGYAGLGVVPKRSDVLALAYESSPVPEQTGVNKCTGACSVRFSLAPTDF